MFAARLVAYVPDGARLGALPDPLDFSAMTAHDDRGSLTVTYSSLATAGEHVERGLDDGLEVAVEAWNGTAWVEPRGCRFALLSRDRDSLDPAKTVSLTLPSWAWLLGQARILDGPFYGPEHAQAGKRGFEAKTVGDILLTLLNENAARDGVPVTATFDAVNDSEGNPWPVLPNQAFEAGADLGAVLDTLTQAGACDWWTQARGLYAVLPDSATAFPVLPATLRATDVSGAPDKETLEGTLGRLMLRTQAGGTVTVDDPAAPAPFGVWEGFTQAGNLADEAAATALAEQTLETAAKVSGQYTRELTLSDTSPRPLIDYWPGAWITAPVSGAQQSVRVQSVTLSLSGGKLGGNVVLNDRLMDATLRRARTLASLAGGGSISPSGPPTAVDPEASRVPTTPTGLANATALTFTGPTPRGVVTPSWNVVTTATDLGTLTISGYELQWRIGAGAWQTILTPELSAQIPDLTPGDAGTTRVRAIGARTTLPSAWSSTVAFTVPGDVTAPPVPTGLSISTARGIVTVTWTGTPTMPVDLDRIEIAIDGTATPTTVVGTLRKAGELPHPDTVGATRRARARAVDTTGNASAWSSVLGPVTVASVVSADIDAAINTAISTAGTNASAALALGNQVVIASMDNLVSDPEFATLGVNTDNWEALAAGETRDATGGYSGTAAWKVVLNGAEHVVAQNTTRWRQADPGTAYRLGLWAKADVAIPANTLTCYIQRRAVGGSTSTLVQIEHEAIPANTVTYITAPIGTLPTSSDAIRAVLRIAAGAGATGNVWLSRPSLTRATNASLIVDGEVKARALAADSVNAGNVEAGSLTADLFEGVLAIVNKFTTSLDVDVQRVEFDPSGIKLYGADGEVLIDLPTTEGVNPTFRGVVEADGLTVREGATFYSPWNEFARDSTINLAEQVAGPVAGPIATMQWPGVPLVQTAHTGFLGTFALNPSEVIGIGPDYQTSTRFYVLQKRPNGTRVWYYKYDGTIDVAGGTFWDVSEMEITGFARSAAGGAIYLAKWAVNGAWFLFNADVSNAYVDYNSANPSTRNVLGYNGTDVLVCEKISATDYRLRRMNTATNPATVIENVNTTGVNALTPALCFVYKGAADFGSTRWVVSHADAFSFRPFTTAGVWDPDRRWDPPVSKVGGLWNPADSKFYTLGSNGTLYEHSGLTWTDPTLNTWHVAQSFVDSNATGGTHESALGAITSFTMKKRAQVKLTLADVPYSGGTDDPNGWSVYAKRGAAPASDYSDMWEQGTGTYLLKTFTMTAAPITTGSNPLEFGDFPDASPALLRSGRTFVSDPTKAVFEVRGDGSGHWGPLEFSSAGALTDDRDTDWLALTLVGGRTNVSGFPAEYCRRGGSVWLRGRVDGVTGTGARSIATLPTAFWPDPEQSTHELGMFSMNSGITNLARLFVSDVGLISCNLNPTSQNTIFLGGSFPLAHSLL